MRRAVRAVLAMARVVAQEAVPRARDLHADERQQEHAEKDVGRHERADRDQRRAFGGEQDEEESRRRSGQAAVALATTRPYDGRCDRRRPRSSLSARVEHGCMAAD